MILAVLAVSALVVGLAGWSLTAGGTSPASPRTSYERQYVPSTATYDIVVRLGDEGRAQSVAVFAAHARRRTLFVPARGYTSIDVRTPVQRGTLVVRAVGSRFTPRIHVVAWDPNAATAIEATSPGGRPYTRLVWSDEFNGPPRTLPAASHWTAVTGAYGHDRELQNFTAGATNASLDGRGDLAIVARRQTTTAGGVTREFTSARLETQGLFSTTYGLIAARIKIPAGVGLWPAFWMLGDDINTVGYPDAGEIDVMEALGQYPFTTRATAHGPSRGSGYSRGQDFVSARSLASRFHTYAVSWRPNSITWLIDGAPWATITPADLAAGEGWVFNKPFHLILDLAVGGNYPGPPNAFTRFPATMLIDWVRVYE